MNLEKFGMTTGSEHLPSRHSLNLQNFCVRSKSSGTDWIGGLVKHSASLEKVHIHSIVRLVPHLDYEPIGFPATPLAKLKEIYLSDFHMSNVNELVSFLTTSGGKLEDVN